MCRKNLAHKYSMDFVVLLTAYTVIAELKLIVCKILGNQKISVK